jgi:hypothetical protein
MSGAIQRGTDNSTSATGSDNAYTKAWWFYAVHRASSRLGDLVLRTVRLGLPRPFNSDFISQPEPSQRNWPLYAKQPDVVEFAYAT